MSIVGINSPMKNPVVSTVVFEAGPFLGPLDIWALEHPMWIANQLPWRRVGEILIEEKNVGQKARCIVNRINEHFKAILHWVICYLCL